MRSAFYCIIIVCCAGCVVHPVQQHPSSTAAAVSEPPSHAQLIPVDAAHLKEYEQLSPTNRALISAALKQIRPDYHSGLYYTWATNGGFHVLLRYHTPRGLDTIVIDGCSEKRQVDGCLHECGLVFNPQYWEVVAVMEWGRCQDGAPVWADS